jgi:hypothetical protein
MRSIPEAILWPQVSHCIPFTHPTTARQRHAFLKL